MPFSIALSPSRPSRVLVSSGSPWEPIVGYARAVRVGATVHVAGTTAVDEAGAVVAPGDLYAQTAWVLGRIAEALKMAGASMDDVVRTRMYVTDISRWEEAARAHGEVFFAIMPATTMVQVAALIDPKMMIEIEAEAIVETAGTSREETTK